MGKYHGKVFLTRSVVSIPGTLQDELGPSLELFRHGLWLFQFTKSRVPFVLVLVRFAPLQALKTISASTLNCSSLERGVLREHWLRELNSLGLETFALTHYWLENWPDPQETTLPSCSWKAHWLVCCDASHGSFPGSTEHCLRLRCHSFRGRQLKLVCPGDNIYLLLASWSWVFYF